MNNETKIQELETMLANLTKALEEEKNKQKIKYVLPFEVNSKGKALKTDKNLDLILAKMGITVRYNAMHNEANVTWNNASCAWTTEGLYMPIKSEAERLGLGGFGQGDINNYLYGLLLRDSYNPAADYLKENIKKFNKEDLKDLSETKKLFSRLEFTHPERTEFYFSLFLKWIVNTTRLAFNTGKINSNGIIVLQGAQSLGKTRFFHSLLPDQSWGKEGQTFRDGNRDEILSLTRYWISELGELGNSITKKNRDALKQFITSNMDLVRRPYGRIYEELPRHTAFMGTINESDMLRDDTGNRRFWILPLKAIKSIDVDINRVWAEVYNLSLTKFPDYLSAEELQKLEEYNSEHRKHTDEELALFDAYDWEAPKDEWKEYKLSDILLQLPHNCQSHKKVGRALRCLGCEQKRIGRGNIVWILPPAIVKTCTMSDFFK